MLYSIGPITIWSGLLTGARRRKCRQPKFNWRPVVIHSRVIVISGKRVLKESQVSRVLCDGRIQCRSLVARFTRLSLETDHRCNILQTDTNALQSALKAQTHKSRFRGVIRLQPKAARSFYILNAQLCLSAIRLRWNSQTFVLSQNLKQLQMDLWEEANATAIGWKCDDDTADRYFR